MYVCMLISVLICCPVGRSIGTSRLDRLSVATGNASSSSKLGQHLPMVVMAAWCWRGHCNCTSAATQTVARRSAINSICCVTRHRSTAVCRRASLVYSESGWNQMTWTVDRTLTLPVLVQLCKFKSLQFNFQSALF